jgi:hypothetical protein
MLPLLCFPSKKHPSVFHSGMFSLANSNNVRTVMLGQTRNNVCPKTCFIHLFYTDLSQQVGSASSLFFIYIDMQQSINPWKL